MKHRRKLKSPHSNDSDESQAKTKTRRPPAKRSDLKRAMEPPLERANIKNVRLPIFAPEECSVRSKEAIEQIVGLRIRIRQLIERADKLGEQIHQVYGGKPFLPEFGPTAPMNRRRFNGYFSRLRKQTHLLLDALRLWMICHGSNEHEFFDATKLGQGTSRPAAKPGVSEPSGFAKRTH